MLSKNLEADSLRRLHGILKYMTNIYSTLYKYDISGMEIRGLGMHLQASLDKQGSDFINIYSIDLYTGIYDMYVCE